jgi:DNA-binding beta-propeller fold protein YncE
MNRRMLATLMASGLGGVVGACDATAPAPELVFSRSPEESWTERKVPPTAVGPLALVTNNYDDTVSYVDLGLSPVREIARIPVGLSPVEREGPHHLVVEPGGEVVWVGISNFVPNSGGGPHGAHGTGASSGYAQAYRVSDGAELARVRVDKNPGDIRITPDGSTILVTHFDLLRITGAQPGAGDDALFSRLAVIDTETRTRVALVPVCPAAHGVVVSPDGTQAFVACWDDRVAVVDLTSAGYPSTTVDVLPIPGSIASPECQPYALTPSRDGKMVWVGCFESGQARAFSTETGAMVAGRVAELGGSVLFGEELADGRLVLPAQARDGLFFINPTTAEVVQEVRFAPADCRMPHIVTQVGERLILVCEGDRVAPGTMVVMDIHGEVEEVLELGRYPDDLAIVPTKVPKRGAP